MYEILIYSLVGLITIFVPLIYFRKERKKHLHAQETLRKSVEQGRDEPVSLHPYIDPNICIGSGACVSACPEGDILGLIRNKAVLIKPSNCVGHGSCATACPVGAITLVFGSEKRGVDIPNLDGHFQSNVPGIYIAGELGGMGLIRNAVIQGKQAADYIAKSIENKNIYEIYDLIIIGAGPAGIAASLQAKKDGLTFLTLDQEDLGGTILSYPRKKLVLTEPVEFPIYGALNVHEIFKEELLQRFEKMFQDTELRVETGFKVDDIIKEDGHFLVKGCKGEFKTQRVLLAIGRRGSPRKLEVPGEKCDKVSYRLLDPEKFHGMDILVVGGGDAAVEAAVALSEQKGNAVYLSYRREAVFRIKEGNQIRFDEAVKNGKITPLFKSAVKSIVKDRVYLEQDGKEIELKNDYIFVFIGGELPVEFLKKAGIEFTTKRGEK